jgi:hypothetical protein
MQVAASRSNRTGVRFINVYEKARPMGAKSGQVGPQPIEANLERGFEGSLDNGFPIVKGVAKAQPAGHEQQAMKAEVSAKKSVVTPISMDGITNDRMGNMSKMTPDLMVTARSRIGLDETVAGGWIPAYRKRQGDARQPAVIRNRRTRGLIHLTAQGMVDGARFGHMTANHRPIDLFNLALREQPTKLPGRRGTESQNDHTRSRSVEAVYRIDAAAQLPPQPLQQGDFFAAGATMDTDSARFGDGDEVVILKENGQEIPGTA